MKNKVETEYSSVHIHIYICTSTNQANSSIHHVTLTKMIEPNTWSRTLRMATIGSLCEAFKSKFLQIRRFAFEKSTLFQTHRGRGGKVER